MQHTTSFISPSVSFAHPLLAAAAAAAALPPPQSKIKETFVTFDTDQDGEINMAELRAMLGRLGEMPSEKHLQVHTYAQAATGGALIRSGMSFRGVRRWWARVEAATSAFRWTRPPLTPKWLASVPHLFGYPPFLPSSLLPSVLPSSLCSCGCRRQ